VTGRLLDARTGGQVSPDRVAEMSAATRLEVLVGGPNLAAAILEALREEVAAATAPHAGPASRWLTVDQAAEYLGTTAKAIRRRIDCGRLEAIRDGRRVYVDRQALDEAFAAKGRMLRATTQKAPAPLTRPGARPQEVGLP
jgi:excisionase family DNA binding protein